MDVGTFGMDRESIIAKLRANEKELRTAGVSRLRLFGSVARGTSGPGSDVDLMAQFDKSRCRTLFDHAGVSSAFPKY
jgi:predicted nucleotidyltransferase